LPCAFADNFALEEQVEQLGHDPRRADPVSGVVEVRLLLEPRELLPAAAEEFQYSYVFFGQKPTGVVQHSSQKSTSAL